MAKAVISNRIYMDNPGTEWTKKVLTALTYKFTKKISSGKSPVVSTEVVKTYRLLPNGVISVPQARTDLIPPHYEILDKRTQIDVPYPEPLFPLREAQLPVYNSVNDTCFINALVGWGKTFTALHIARKLGQKTLVVTHTSALRDQWCEEINTLYNSSCGVIGGGVFDTEDHYITVGNIQTLVKHKERLAKEYGTIILDEAHHCPASTFTDFIDSSYARYRIALSGTMIRKDQKHKLFPDFFGTTVFTPPQSDTLTPVVKLLKPGIILKPGGTWVEKITELTQDPDYVRFIAGTALAQMANGHSVLVIADRVEFLKQVAEYVGEEGVLVTGETSFEERQIAKEQLLSGQKKCVCGSRQIFSEGISINSLSCAILAIPMSNDSLLEQIVGRIQRQHPGKKSPPEVLDVQFSGWADKKQNNDRLALYLRKGWEVITV